MTVICIPGSYDPVTRGHLSLIEKASRIGDVVYAAIFINPDKSYRFSLEERLELLRIACRPYPNVKVVSDSGTGADFAKQSGVTYLLKGVRNETDFLYEREMADVNRERGIETLLLPAEPSLREVSSSEVRRRLDANEAEDGLLPPEVEAYLKSISNKP